MRRRVGLLRADQLRVVGSGKQLKGLRAKKTIGMRWLRVWLRRQGKMRAWSMLLWLGSDLISLSFDGYVEQA